MSSFSSSPAACLRRGIAGFVPQHLLATLLAVVLLGGCSPIWDSPPTKNGAGVGAAAGAVVGAVVGAGVGAVAGNTEAGLAVGTLSGAAIGAYVGNEAQKQANAGGHSEDLKNQEEELNLQQENINEQKNNLRDASFGGTTGSGRTETAGNSRYKHVQGSYLGSSGPVSGGSPVSGRSGVTVVSPSSRTAGSAAIRSGQPAGGRVYINPPSSYSSASSSAGKVSGGQQYAALGSKSSTDGVSATGKAVKRIPAPPIERRPNSAPPAPALPVDAANLSSAAAAKPGNIIETNSSGLPSANTGSVLPPPAGEVNGGENEGLPKLDVDDGTVKALEADSAGEDDVLGSVAEPIEGPDQPRARLEDTASASQTVAGLPPPKRDESGTAAIEQPGTPVNEKLLPAEAESRAGNSGIARSLPEPEKEVIGSAIHSAPAVDSAGDHSSAGSPVKSGAAPQLLPATNECKQASAEVQRAKSSVSDADRLFYYRRAVRLCSGEPTYHVEIGKLYINLGRIEDAKFEFRQAIDLDPSNQPAREQLGKLESGGGKL